jgi:uncharacterized protein (TIGR03083 family)
VRPDVTFVLTGECARLAEVLTQLDEPSFGRATRCQPWTVKELVGHLWRGMDRLPSYLAEPPAEAAADDAVSYFRYDAVAEGPEIAAQSSQVAARFDTGVDLARSFDEHWRTCVDAARAADPARLLRTRVSGGIRLDEFCATRVLEVAVHGLDIARALDLEPWITPAGAEVTTSILRSLFGGEPPRHWDAVTFIETGTGRRPPDARDLDALGPSSSFPLLA